MNGEPKMHAVPVKEHTLKTRADCWDAIEAGSKPFEVRRDDRGYQRGDILVLRRLDPTRPHIVECDLHGNYKEIRKRVSYILTGGQFGIEPGYVVMGLQDV